MVGEGLVCFWSGHRPGGSFSACHRACRRPGGGGLDGVAALHTGLQFPPEVWDGPFQLWFRGFHVFNFGSFIPVAGEQFLGLASIPPLSEPGQHAANEFAKLETPNFTRFFSRWPRLWLC